MISLRQRLQCFPLLSCGMGAGLILAVLPRISSGGEAEQVTLIIVIGLSFALAALTGVAKSTTA